MILIPMIKRLRQKYQTTGFSGVSIGIRRQIFHWINPPFDPVSLAIKALLQNQDFTIVQIGAYIGDSSNDPLFKSIRRELKKSRGRLICIEPVKEHFDALVENYRRMPNVICENVAIAEKNGEASFYRLGVNPVDYGYPEWLSQLGSLKKDRMETLWDKYESNQDYKQFYLQHRVEDTVQCITFTELLRRHSTQSVDLLQIDAEGYEFEILRSIDFHENPIRFVNYERVLLQQNTSKVEKLMKNMGYLLFNHKQDTFCCREEDKESILG